MKNKIFSQSRSNLHSQLKPRILITLFLTKWNEDRTCTIDRHYYIIHPGIESIFRGPLSRALVLLRVGAVGYLLRRSMPRRRLSRIISRYRARSSDLTPRYDRGRARIEDPAEKREGGPRPVAPLRSSRVPTPSPQHTRTLSPLLSLTSSPTIRSISSFIDRSASNIILYRYTHLVSLTPGYSKDRS